MLLPRALNGAKFLAGEPKESPDAAPWPGQLLAAGALLMLLSQLGPMTWPKCCADDVSRGCLLCIECHNMFKDCGHLEQLMVN